jgi:hypothetical protein
VRVGLSILAALLPVIAVLAWPRRLAARTKNLHDPKWKPTGYTTKFAGHDQAQGERARAAAALREMQTRKAAATICVTPPSGKPVDIATRRHAR